MTRELSAKDAVTYTLGEPPTDPRQLAQYDSTIEVLQAMSLVASKYGEHHALNGTMSAIVNFVTLMELAPGGTKPGLRKVVADFMRDSATSLERLGLTPPTDTKQ